MEKLVFATAGELAAAIRQGDVSATDFDWSALTLHRVTGPSDPEFDPAYRYLRAEFGPRGEMEPAQKHGMSHRADAFRQLVAACFAP